ncbi:MAG: SWIM zinc finger family protein [Nitrososphaera sp.]
MNVKGSRNLAAPHWGFFTKRQLRGLGILARGGQIWMNRDEDGFCVKSQTADGTYNVDRLTLGYKDRWSCNCPDFVKTGRSCKHVYAVQYWLRLPDISQANGYRLTVGS